MLMVGVNGSRPQADSTQASWLHLTVELLGAKLAFITWTKWTLAMA